MIRRRNTWPQVFSAFAIGLGAGAALGLLFAPQSGKTPGNCSAAPPRTESMTPSIGERP